VIGDLARYAFWVHLRQVLDPSDRDLVLTLASAGSVGRFWTTPRRRLLIHEELKATFPSIAWTHASLRHATRSAYDLHTQCALEELLLGRLHRRNVEQFMTFHQRENLDKALSHGKGAVLVFPHAGNVMLLIALISLFGYDFTQLAARGFPPTEHQRTSDMRPTWFNRKARTAREVNEDRLPARFVTIEDSPRDLYRTLERNGILAIAFDGRGGQRFRPTPFLGRTALLAPGPWKLSARTGAPIVPALCIRSSDRRHRLHLCPPVFADPDLPLQSRCEALQTTVLREHIEPLLLRHPDHYGPWLLHCRLHAHMDDRPLFVDQATDHRWQRHEKTRF